MQPDQRGLILDFGGVISRTLFETHEHTEKALGLAPGMLKWRGPFDPASDPLWCSMQADEISEREYWRLRTIEVSGLVGEQWSDMADFVKAARGDSANEVIRPQFLQAIGIARSMGVHLAILSNELDLFYGAEFRTRLPFLQEFDVIHDATYTGILKPEPQAFEACVDDLGLDIARCVFVDDQLRNVEGARKVGLQSIHFDVRNPEDSFSAALRLLRM